VTIPFIIVSALAAYGWVVLDDIEAKEPGALVVNVTGQQFSWRFNYPEDGKVRVNELVLPQGRQVLFRVKTDDVIHDFWVPEFRLKTDAVPGLTTHIRTTPTRTGTFHVVCAELCGIGHSTMRQSVTVLPADEFDGWLADEQQALAAAGGGEAEVPEDQSPSGVAAQEPAPAPAGGEGGGETGQGGAEQEGGSQGGEGDQKPGSEGDQGGGSGGQSGADGGRRGG
jgi:cytochrome c oxidase subunit II